MPPTVPKIIYHITPADYFRSTDPNKDYFPFYFEEEGFIHATMEPEWVERIAARIYGGKDGDILLLEVDTTKIHAEIIMEESKGRWYPHIYGGMNRDAILRIVAMERDAEGRLLFPSDWR